MSRRAPKQSPKITVILADGAEMIFERPGLSINIEDGGILVVRDATGKPFAGFNVGVWREAVQG